MTDRHKYYTPYNPYELEIQSNGVEALASSSYWTMSAFNITHVKMRQVYSCCSLYSIVLFHVDKVNQLDHSETTITPALVWLWERYRYKYLITRLSCFSTFR
jgi:hypothetical protein